MRKIVFALLLTSNCIYAQKTKTEPLPAECWQNKLVEYEDNNDFYPESEDLVAVKKKAGKWGFINLCGKEVIPFIYDKAWFFQEGKAMVALKNKWGFIDKNGKTLIPFIYEEVGLYYNNRARVNIKGKEGIIDETGKVIIPLIYESIYHFSDGMVWALKDKKWGAFNLKGENTIPFIYDEVNDFWEGKARVKKRGKEFYISKKNIIIK